MKYYRPKQRELEDEKIVADLRKAIPLYEDGCIMEVYEILQKICAAIEVFAEEVKP